MQQALGTLAASTGIRQLLADTVVDTTWCSSVRAVYAMGNYTGIANAGPIVVYVAHSDYTLAEVEEVIEQTGSWDPGNKIAQERGRRKVKLVGQFYPQGGSGAAATNDLNEGRPLTTKLGWMLTEGDTLQYVFYNTGTQALATTDPIVEANGHANLWPV